MIVTPNFVKRQLRIGENKLVDWCHEQDINCIYRIFIKKFVKTQVSENKNAPSEFISMHSVTSGDNLTGLKTVNYAL